MLIKNSATAKKNWGTLLRWGGTLVSTILFLWLILRQRWDVVLEKASGLSIWILILAVAFYLVSYWFNTLRWCILLWAQGVRLSIWRAYQLTWAGNFASNFLPSTIGGDGFRMLAIHPYTGRKTISVGSVVLDRIINMSAMACLVPVSLAIFGSSLKSLLGFAILLPENSKPPKSAARNLMEKYFPKIQAAIKSWSSKPWSFFYAFLAAWPSNLFPISATFLIARQLGISVNFWQVVGVQTVSYFLSVLPISVNGYGLREVVYTTLYTSLGASVEQASTLALVTRFLTVLSTIPGAVWLTRVVDPAVNVEENLES